MTHLLSRIPVVHLALFATSLCCFVACGDSDEEDGPSTTSTSTSSTSSSSTTSSETTSTGTTSTTSTSSTSSTSEPDPPRDPSCPAEAAYIARAQGDVVFSDGTPAAGAKSQACIRTNAGTLLCLRPSDVDQDGTFSVSVPENARCLDRFTFRALLVRDDSTTLYCAVPPPLDQTVMDVGTPLTLFPTQRPENLPPEGDETAAREITFPNGLVFNNFVPDLYTGAGDGYEALAAGTIDPTDPALCFLTDDRPDGLIGFSPEGDLRDGGVSFSVPNTSNLPADTTVDLFVLGGLDCKIGDELLEEADWHKFGTGTVSSDGTTITSDPDSNLPCMTWLGWKAQ